MLAALEHVSSQLPPRLKALLNLATTVILVLMAIPGLWEGISEGEWEGMSLGAGLLLLGVFNLFT